MRRLGTSLGRGLAVVAFTLWCATAGAQTIPDKAQAESVGDMLAVTPGGITAEQVGARAMATSYTAKSAESLVNAAGQRADAAWTNYLPRLGLTARYTRLSEFTVPSASGDSSIIGSNVASGTCVANCPPGFPGGTNTGAPLVGVSFAFPQIYNQYLTQATIAVPISDYFLRIGKAYTAALQQEDAARFDVMGARAKSYADGKVAYFTWLRARGAVNIAVQSLGVAQAHLKDAQNQFTVGNASKADVLRAETQVAAAELAVERAKSGVVLTERQIRVAIHAKEEDNLAPGDPLDAQLPALSKDVKAMVSEAQGARPEMKSIEKNAEAARKQAEVFHAGKYPVLSGFGDVTYANPNPRRFPQTDLWFPTWSVGAQVTWSPNDFFLAGPNAGDAEARAAALDAQRQAVRDGIEIEVISAYQAAIEAEAAMTSTARQLDSAVEGYRVARELFNNGRGTATTLIDAEIVLAQTRFDQLNARVDARIARIRLDHALGRDVKANP